jgi:murein DD-endopeptidase MepM/ murein hydrolase activator NlpD
MMSGKEIRRGVIRSLPYLGLSLAGVISIATLRIEAQNTARLPAAGALRPSPGSRTFDALSRRLAEARVPVDFVLNRGESLRQALLRFGLPAGEARVAANVAAPHFDARSLRAGSPCRALFASDSSLAALEVTIPASGKLRLARASEGWKADWTEFQRGSELRVLRGTLDGSFETSIRRAGGPAGLAYRIADTLRWDFDFHRDLRRGDTFSVLYREKQVNGEFFAIEDLIAVRYQSAGRLHEAYRFAGGDTYYDGEGRPLKTMFLRAPLRFSHITSSFSENRFHPVLHELRPHYGVDYAAPVGTPVEVTADGTVTFAGWDGGGGNVVKVQHLGSYQTAYLHLSRFAGGVHSGSHVRQGDVIAYTGATGLATGPHLDYRIKYRDQWINPVQLKTMRSEPISTSDLVAFRAWKAELQRGLEQGTVPALVQHSLLGPHPAHAAVAEPIITAR